MLVNILGITLMHQINMLIINKQDGNLLSFSHTHILISVNFYSIGDAVCICNQHWSSMNILFCVYNVYGCLHVYVCVFVVHECVCAHSCVNTCMPEHLSESQKTQKGCGMTL